MQLVSLHLNKVCTTEILAVTVIRPTHYELFGPHNYKSFKNTLQAPPLSIKFTVGQNISNPIKINFYHPISLMPNSHFTYCLRQLLSTVNNIHRALHRLHVIITRRLLKSHLHCFGNHDIPQYGIKQYLYSHNISNLNKNKPILVGKYVCLVHFMKKIP